MVECNLPKVDVRVRSPLLALKMKMLKKRIALTYIINNLYHFLLSLGNFIKGYIYFMKLSDFFEKYVRVFTCNDLIIIGEVIDYYPAIGTESGEDEIDIFPDGINHIIRLKESDIVAIEEIFLDSNS